MGFNALEILLSVFFAALLVSVLFRQLKLSVILGYLCVGILVGPHALGWVHDSAYINTLAEFGIVFLMFSVGLEFSLSRLFALKNAVFIIGGLQVVLCVGVTTLLGKLFGISLLAALVTGSIVAMSSTALVIKQLNDQFELQSPHGLNAVGILLFQDLAVIPLIILVSSFASGSTHSLPSILLWALFKGIVAIIGIFVLGRWLLRPLFRLISRTRAIELFTLTVLLVTLTAAWLTERMGLSYALGAFLAGIMLAETEFRHQIEVEIRPFRDMLLALFFITIGMLANIGAWYQAWVYILLLIAAMTFGKMLLIVVLSRFTGQYASTAVRTGIILAQGGEFGFAILNLAMSHKILTPQYEQILLGALLISLAISPILIRFNRKIADLLLRPAQKTPDASSQLEIIEHAKHLQNHVVICGYGRVGQHIARVLDRLNLEYIGIDFNAELVRRASLAGDHVIYADAAHPEILSHSGISNAKILVICVSDHNAAVKIASIVQTRYPHVPLLVRCHDKAQLKQLKKMGILHIITEIYETSLSLSTELLHLINLPTERINQVIQEVRNSDYELLQRVFISSLEKAAENIDTQEHLSPVIIPENAYAVGQRLANFKFRDMGIEIIAIRRGDNKLLKPNGQVKLKANDIVVMFGGAASLEQAERVLLDGR